MTLFRAWLFCFMNFSAVIPGRADDEGPRKPRAASLHLS
jgi:hypothetical protein